MSIDILPSTQLVTVLKTSSREKHEARRSTPNHLNVAVKRDKCFHDAAAPSGSPRFTKNSPFSFSNGIKDSPPDSAACEGHIEPQQSTCNTGCSIKLNVNAVCNTAEVHALCREPVAHLVFTRLGQSRMHVADDTRRKPIHLVARPRRIRLHDRLIEADTDVSGAIYSHKGRLPSCICHADCHSLTFQKLV
eukprot:6210145-Pleurochrysis_carterae.AAC.2